MTLKTNRSKAEMMTSTKTRHSSRTSERKEDKEKGETKE